MTGNVELHHAIARHAVKEFVGGEAVVESADKDVLTSNRSQQSARRATSLTNSHSVISDWPKVT
jgi:hypothetical protein